MDDQEQAAARRLEVALALRGRLDLSHLDDEQVDALADNVVELADAFGWSDAAATNLVIPALRHGLDQARRLEAAFERVGQSLSDQDESSRRPPS